MTGVLVETSVWFEHFRHRSALATREHAYTKSWAEIIRKTGFQPL